MLRTAGVPPVSTANEMEGSGTGSTGPTEDPCPVIKLILFPFISPVFVVFLPNVLLLNTSRLIALLIS